MTGTHTGQKELFSYEVSLDRRVRADHPLRAIRATVDFRCVRQAVAPCYGHNGQVSVDPEVILKLMFLLFLDNVKSERELRRLLPERLDYLWFPAALGSRTTSRTIACCRRRAPAGARRCSRRCSCGSCSSAWPPAWWPGASCTSTAACSTPTRAGTRWGRVRRS
ncbi:MAG: transposase [Pseudomonadota bacterium]